MKSEILAQMCLPLLVVLGLAVGIYSDESPTQPAADQVFVYVGDPDKAWKGESSCGPCNKLCRDLKENYKTDQGRYVIGIERLALFRLIKAPKGMATPSFRYPGRRKTVRGYDGDHLRLVSSHPASERIKSR